MATKVKIKNFQSIGSTEFTIDGFTVIVGKNNIGKSAVVRSIDAALTNRAGKEFIRHGTKNTEVTINREGLDIDWKKGAKTTCTVNGETYSALNRSVPQQLLDAGFRRLEVGTEKLNPLLASQFEPLFLLNKTGSVITEALSAMYRLDVISTADDLCQKQLRATKSMHKTRSSDLENLDEKLEKFKGFDEIKVAVEEARKLKEKCDALESEVSLIESFERQILELSTEIQKLKGIKDVTLPDVDMESQIRELERLEGWNDSLKECAGLVRSLNAAVGAVRGVDDVEVTHLETLIQELKTVIGYEGTFSESVRAAKSSKKELEDAEKALEEVEQKLGEFKICPLCERPL